MKTLHVAGKSIPKFVRKHLKPDYLNERGYLVLVLLGTLAFDGFMFYYSVGFQVGMRVNADVYLSQVYPGQKMTAEVHCARSGAASGASGVGLLLYELGCRLTVK
ncbi:MAG: hypothetical protein ACKOWK_03475 [Micrococcales bacterium]